MAEASSTSTALAERLRRHVVQLAAVIGERHVWRPRALHAAADYLREEWRRQGHAVASQHYMAYGVRSENLEIAFTDATPSTEIVLVGAHYDSVPGSPGADDNASGVAGLLEIGRAIAGRHTGRAWTGNPRIKPCGGDTGSASGRYTRSGSRANTES